MGWAIGEDRDRGRFIGYGVPATCDQPGCGKGIDRGLGYACGGGVVGTVENCGLFFCGGHLRNFAENDEGGGESVCDRCANGDSPFDPTPDTVEWVEHMLTDDSWQKWRSENPECVAAMRREAA